MADDGFISRGVMLAWDPLPRTPLEFVAKLTGVPADLIEDYEIEEAMYRWGYIVRRLKVKARG